MTVEKSSKHNALINDIANIRWNQWYKWNKKSILFEDILLETNKFSKKIFVALNEKKKLLWFWWIFNESGINRKNKWLWLKSLYVNEKHRREWVATQILKSIKKEIIKNKQNLFLYDSSWIEWFYEKQWFEFLEKHLFENKFYFIYKLKI